MTTPPKESKPCPCIPYDSVPFGWPLEEYLVARSACKVHGYKPAPAPRSEAELLPCPFCGDLPYVPTDGDKDNMHHACVGGWVKRDFWNRRAHVQAMPLTGLPKRKPSIPAPTKDPERCRHGVWIADHCYSCEKGDSPAEGKDRCAKCGQRNRGQTGEYPCSVCGLPTLWDDGVLGEFDVLVRGVLHRSVSGGLPNRGLGKFDVQVLHAEIASVLESVAKKAEERGRNDKWVVAKVQALRIQADTALLREALAAISEVPRWIGIEVSTHQRFKALAKKLQARLKADK